MGVYELGQFLVFTIADFCDQLMSWQVRTWLGLGFLGVGRHRGVRADERASVKPGAACAAVICVPCLHAAALW